MAESVQIQNLVKTFGSTRAVDNVTLLVEPGEQVARGARLGIVGETGSFSGPSLYFELRLAGRAVDPKLWLREK